MPQQQTLMMMMKLTVDEQNLNVASHVSLLAMSQSLPKNLNVASHVSLLAMSPKSSSKKQALSAAAVASREVALVVETEHYSSATYLAATCGTLCGRPCRWGAEGGRVTPMRLLPRLTWKTVRVGEYRRQNKNELDQLVDTLYLAFLFFKKDVKNFYNWYLCLSANKTGCEHRSRTLSQGQTQAKRGVW